MTHVVGQTAKPHRHKRLRDRFDIATDDDDDRGKRPMPRHHQTSIIKQARGAMG
jgi:hypothetical protein